MRIDRLTGRENSYTAHSLQSVVDVLKKDLSFSPEVPQSPVGHQEKDVTIEVERLPLIAYRREKDGY